MKSRRRGYTLIECSVVVSVTAAAFGLIVPLLQSLYQADHRIRDRLARDAALERLTDQLRSDAHQAQSAKIESPDGSNTPATRLSLSMTHDRTIQYSLLARRIERIVRQAGAIRHRETYPIRFAPESHWEIQQDRMPPLLSLILQPPPDSPARQAAPIEAQRVDAAVRLLPARLRPVQPRG